jgi:hypothetical protein
MLGRAHCAKELGCYCSTLSATTREGAKPKKQERHARRLALDRRLSERLSPEQLGGIRSVS